ncbi:sulfatase family protein [Thermogutta terrifontis]|nr:arylsulfatase [Thermogutta terrifontis]
MMRGLSATIRCCNKRKHLALGLALALCWGWMPQGGQTHAEESRKANPPHIVLILADDLGYGDLSCLNPESKIATPRIDQLAREGMIFTDAHTPSSVCTPTRYGLLTGRYAWRTRLQRGVLLGFDRPLIEPNRMTLASLLRSHGYRTACVGKWHLGLGWQSPTGQPVTDSDGTTNDPGVDYSKPLTEGPLTVGFDYFFGIAASLDMAPYCYIENDHVTQPPTEDTKGRDFPFNWRPGKKAQDFAHEEVLPTLTEKAIAWLRSCRRESPDQPVFLYFALTAPHTPVLPLSQYHGKSRAGEYGDFVVQVDDCVGKVLDALDDLGMRQNTLVIVTSDNGSTMTIRPFFQKFNHATNYHFRGQKSDIWEGGHRVPFIVRWPGHVPPGSQCSRTICLTDCLATFAELMGTSLPENAGEDSVSFLNLLTNPEASWERPPVVMHSVDGHFAIREGDWKLLLCRGSGGWSLPENKVPESAPPAQLYNLREDIGEKNNLFHHYPNIVARLSKLLENIRESGHSR